MIGVFWRSKRSDAWMQLQRAVAVMLLFAATAVFSSPKIAFNKKTADAGVAVEGQNSVVEASFIIKNTGSSNLKLEKIVPSCGCTKIRYYDSLVEPGKSGKIEAVMDLDGFRSGPVNKTITVVSNAENEPTVRLIIKATVQEIIKISVPYISINANHPSPLSIYAASKKRDLEISEISFRAEQDPGEVSRGWQTEMPFVIPHKWSPTDSTASDGYRFYKLHLFMPAIDRSMLGMFTLKTNHPDKPEIFIRGTLLK